jgi:transposase InsO family protein
MTNDDVIYRHRLRILALASECGSVAKACRIAGIHRSTFYRWQAMVERFGLEILRPRERRSPQMPNAVPVLIEQRVLAFSLGHPGLGPRRISAELARPLWGGFTISPAGVWRVLARHGLSTRTKRLALIAGYAAPPEPERPEPEPERHLEVSRPGELVQMDAFCVGRLAGTKGTVWQYTAIDAASSYVWAELHVTPRNPDVRFCSALAKRVAHELSAAGWRLERVTTDHGSEFRNHVFDAALARLDAQHTLISPGRPQSNGFVERVQRTILEECWKPAFARYLIPKYMGLRRELARYLAYYNCDRAHTGRLTQGRTPAEVLGAAKMYR